MNRVVLREPAKRVRRCSNQQFEPSSATIQRPLSEDEMNALIEDSRFPILLVHGDRDKRVAHIPSQGDLQWSFGSSAWIFLFLFAYAFCAAGAQSQSSEYDLKAVCLYNLVQFTEWPPSAFPETNSPLVIGILGEDPFGSTLEEAVRGEKVNGRTVVIQRYHRSEEVRKCHAVFISNSESARLDRILNGLKSRSILTVGESESFTKKGGIVGLAIDRNKLRLSINLEAARSSGLTMSSKLLRLADIVSVKKT
jgi:hypothetical protein